MIKLCRLLLACLLFEAIFALFHEKSFLVQDGATDVNAIALYKDSILHTSSKDILEKDIATGILLRTFRAHSSLIDSFVVSEDNRMITSGFDNMIIVWDLVTGSILKRISLGASETRIQRIVLKNDQLFAGGLDGFARQINLRTGRVAKSIDLRGSVSCIVVDGDFLYAGNTVSHKVIDRIHIGTFTVFSSLAGHSDSVTALHLYNSFLFSGSADAIIYCWNLDTETVLRTLIGHSGLVSALEVVNEDLYSGSYDTNIIKWNTETGQMIEKFPSIHFNFVKCLTGRDQSLFSGADDTYVIWWNLTSVQANLIYKNRNKKLRSIALWKSAVFSGGEDYSITMWDTGLNSVEPVASLTGHTYPVNTISVYEDDLFSGSSDTTIRQWNLLNQTFIKDFVGHTFGITSIDVGNSYVYSGSFDLSIKKWDISSGDLVSNFLGHIGDIATIVLENTHLFSGGAEKSILMWDVDSVSTVRFYTAPNVIFAVFVAYDSLFAGLSTGITRFELTSSEEGYYFEETVSCYCIGSIGTRIYSGHHDGLVRGRDSLSLVILETFHGHSDSVLSLCLDFSGILYSSGFDGSIKKWNTALRTLAFSFEDRGWSVSALSAVGSIVVVGYKNGFIGLYTIDDAYLTSSGFLHAKEVTSLVPQERELFSSGLEGRLSVYSFETGKSKMLFDSNPAPIKHFAVHQKSFVVLKGDDKIDFIERGLANDLSFSFSTPIPVLCLAVSENAVIAGAKSGAVLVWDIETRLFLFDLKGHSAQVNSLVIDQNNVYSASDDKIIIEWSLDNQVESRKFQRLSANSLGHLGPVNSLSICGDSLFSGGSDIVTRRWNLRRGNHEDVYFGPSKSVTVVLCHNRSVFSGSEDYSVLMYRPYFPEEIIATSTTRGKTATSKSLKLVRVMNSSKSNTNVGVNQEGLFAGIALILLFVVVVLLFLRQRRIRKDDNINSNLFTSRAETSYSVTDLETVINSVMGISKHAAYLMETSAFAMIKKIAIGGGGELYLTSVMDPALRKKIGKTVIQKIIFVKNDARHEAFYQEIGIMIMLLPFPNFCRKLGYTENPMSIILEFYPDGSLNEWLKTRICSKGNLLKILREISQGLNVMHSYFLAHCDLKPQNILVKVSNGIPSFFITDFGITQVLSESIIAAKSFNIINLRGLSVHYASPEAFTSFRSKKYSRVDFKMFDVYSFGCLTYEVQTRRMPWV